MLEARPRTETETETRTETTTTRRRRGAARASHGAALLAACAAMALLAATASCDDLVGLDCPGCVSRADAAPAPPQAPPAATGFVPPCGNDSLDIPGNGAVCVDDPPSAAPAGTASCTAPTDCPGVCCEPGPDGDFFPAAAPPDAGAADARADAGAGEGGPPPGSQAHKVWACSCGVCLAPAETCATANRPRGLGGP